MGDIHEAILVIHGEVEVMNSVTLIFAKIFGNKSCLSGDDINVLSLPYPLFMSLFLSCQKYVFGSQPTLPFFPMSLILLFFFEVFP